MKLAYIISAYRLPDQLIRLVHRLDDGEARFLIHVDARRPGVQRRITNDLAGHPRVELLDPHPCYWGDFGHVRASLKGISSLARSSHSFDYAVLLTGQDYPIKPLDWIHRFFGRSPGAIYLNHFPLPRPAWRPRGGLDRIEYPHVRILGRSVRLPIKRRIPLGHAPFGGASYWAFPRHCVDYVHRFVSQHPEYVRYFEHVRVPDELFFQTLILNSPLQDRVVDEHPHFLVWSDAPNPETLTRQHLTACLASDRPFARRFDVEVDDAVLDGIDEQVFGEAPPRASASPAVWGRVGIAARSDPRASVVMAAFNAERFVAQAVESILQQTFQSWELVIVDDGSTDSTPSILASYSDPRIRVYRNDSNIGQTASLNRGIELARGEFIARMDADDVSEPGRLELQVGFLDRNPEVALLGGQYTQIDEYGHTAPGAGLPLQDEDLRWAMLFYCPFVHAAVMFRRTPVVDTVGVYDEALSYSMDFDLWVRIAARFSVANLPQRLVRYRRHPGSMTASGEERTREGRRIRERMVAELLGWEEAEERIPERYARMLGLVMGGEVAGGARDVERAVQDVLSARSRVADRWFTPAYRLRHRRALRSDLSKRILIQAASRAVSDLRAASSLATLALRLHGSGWLRGIPAATRELITGSLPGRRQKP